MPWCLSCDRFFNEDRGYWQHMNNSSAHASSSPIEDEVYECDGCYAAFFSHGARKQHSKASHIDRYCVPCDRMFQNPNNLMQHQHSRTHVGSAIPCPFCKTKYTTASGLTIHLESGTCTSGLNRQKINNIVRQMDTKNMITRPMIEMPGYTDIEQYATEHSWNGWGYECYLCDSEFSQLQRLNSHLKSPVHEQKMYRCPGRACGNTYKTLSGLVQHIESESCGFMRFAAVQKQAKAGVEVMFGRMILG